MSQKKHTPEQIISKLPFGFAQGGEPAEPREAEVELAQGATVPQACKKIGVTDQALDISILKEAAAGNY